MSTDITGYGMREFGATLERVIDCSHSPQPSSARVDVGDEGVVSMGSMVDGCNEDGEDRVVGDRRVCSWSDKDEWRASVSCSTAALSMMISSSISDTVKQG